VENILTQCGGSEISFSRLTTLCWISQAAYQNTPLNVTILTYNRERHAILRSNRRKAGNHQRYKFIPVLICDGITLHARVSPLITTTSLRITRRHCFPSLRNPRTGKRLAKASAAERVGVPRRVKSCRYS